MITHETSADIATRWLAGYLAGQPGRIADSAQVRDAAASELGFQPTRRHLLRQARDRLGVEIHTGSLPGRPFASFWHLPDREQLKLSDAERAAAERVVSLLANCEVTGAQEVVARAGAMRVALALALLVLEARER